MDCSKNSASGEAAANTGARFLITAEQKTRGRFWNSVEQQIICIWRFWTGGELAKSKWHVFSHTDRVGHQSLFLIEITPQNHSQWWSENHWWLDKVQHCGILGTPSWFARSCKNAAGKLSRGGKQQQGPISPNHVQAIKGPSVWITVANHATLDARLNQNAWSRLDSAYCLKSRRQERYPTNRPFQRMGSTKSAF